MQGMQIYQMQVEGEWHSRRKEQTTQAPKGMVLEGPLVLRLALSAASVCHERGCSGFEVVSTLACGAASDGCTQPFFQML